MLGSIWILKCAKMIFKKILLRLLPTVFIRWYRCAKAAMDTGDVESVFTRKYQKNVWGSRESTSGLGSELQQTKRLVEILPNLLKEFQVTSFLDAPCGDLNWMQYVNFDGVEYTGIDIVAEIIAANKIKYPDFGQFLHLDMIKDPLPKADMIFAGMCSYTLVMPIFIGRFGIFIPLELPGWP